MPLRKFSIDNRYANRRNAKIYKIMPHLFVPGYDYYIWVDATHAVKMDPKEIVYLGHGTTVALNMLLERRAQTIGLLTTKGFRDVLEIARQIRPNFSLGLGEQ